MYECLGLERQCVDYTAYTVILYDSSHLTCRMQAAKHTCCSRCQCANPRTQLVKEGSCVACRSMAEGAADTLKAGTDMSCAGDAPIIFLFPPLFLHIFHVCFLDMC